ncbi:MAG TPA: ABC transporter ATP-binding protein [Thermoanaerobaculia bacterium]|jgi:ABC-type polysaccharide/polyol phosphate transport system ATPase subunit
MEIAVRSVELTKQYEIYPRPADRILEMITRRPRHTVFPALQDVTFEVEKGEAVGIVGQNGAGKSTLLKLLCGVTRPTSGTIESFGTIASILELGTGFHPEFSGRDNAALNAAILGLSPAEVKRKLPSILEFSELGTFLDRPVKTYSSGMYMRLAFSVAVNVDPDILVIDEALAVGDGHFQKKCVDRIREFQQQRKTILFCSHALYHVTSICRRSLWLDHGSVMRYGPTLDVVHEYESFLLQRDRALPASEGEPERERPFSPVRFRDIVVCDSTGSPRDLFERGEDIHFRVRVHSDDPSQPIHIILGVHRSADDLQCFAVGTHADGVEPLYGRNEYEFSVELKRVPLNRGEYSIIAFVGDENAITVFDRRDVRPAFSVGGDRYEVGLVTVDHRWAMEPVDAAVVGR